MRAVLINEAGVRLGWKGVCDDCRIINFGGAIFAATGEEAICEDGERGQVFEQALVDVVRDLDVFRPTRLAHAAKA